MNILELGTNIAPAYAGMILAEQGHQVTKWTTDDPLAHQSHGRQLWDWLNHAKQVTPRHVMDLADLDPGTFDGVVDNFRAASWVKWGLDPAEIAERWRVPWVSMRADDDGRSFDVIAQARAWGDITPPVPFYLGDTAFGLWAAFKLLAMSPGHAVIRHATCLAKLVDGEAFLERGHEPYPWKQPGTYGWDGEHAFTIYHGERIEEPLRTVEWRRANLRHSGGRYSV